MKAYRFVICVLFGMMFSFNIAIGQIDSLHYDTTIKQIKSSLLKNNRSDSILNEIHAVLSQCKKIHYQVGEMHSYNLLSQFYMNHFDSCYKYIKNEELLRYQFADSNSIQYTLRIKAWVYGRYSYFPLAIEALTKAIKYTPANPDSTMLGNIHFQLAYTYNGINRFESSMEHYQKAIQYFGPEDKKSASCYLNMGSMLHSREQNSESLKYILKAKKINEKYNMPLNHVKANLGSIYESQGKYDKALKLLTEAADSIHLNVQVLTKVNIYGAIAKTYLKLGKVNQSIQFAKKSYDLAHQANYIEGISKASNTLRQCYYKKQFYDSSEIYTDEHLAMVDTIMERNRSESAAMILGNYEILKRDHEIASVSQQNKIKDLQIQRGRILQFAYIGGIGLVVIALAFMIRAFVIKRKSNKVLAEKNQIIEVQKKRIIDSIEYAHSIQQSILITEKQVSQIIPKSFVYYKPKDIVSGDFYWMKKVKDDIIIAAADCTGHGVPGGFMSMMGNSLLNDIIYRQNITEPGKVLEKLHQGVRYNLSQNEETTSRNGMDISLCKISKKNHTLEFSGAKNSAYLLQEGEMTELRAEFKSIGGVPLRKEVDGIRTFKTQKTTYKPGTFLYLFSDGYVDQMGGDNRKKLGIKRFRQMLQEISKMNISQQKKYLQEFMTSWIQNYSQIDDQMVMGLYLD